MLKTGQTVKFRHFTMDLAAVNSLLIISVAFVCLLGLPQPSHAGVEWSGKINPANPTTWTRSTDAFIGNGTLNITNSGAVYGHIFAIGSASGSTGEVTVSGAGSTLTSDAEVDVGSVGNGTLKIIDGALVNSSIGGRIGSNSLGSTGEVTVDGAGSTWMVGSVLSLGREGSGTLNIANGGLVATESLEINENGNGYGVISMSTGGMLALYGDTDGSLLDFLDPIYGTKDIRYWDDYISDWADITAAKYGEDYTLSYKTDGDLTGYTVLTVGVIPEPSTLTGLLGLCLAGLLGSLRRKR